MTIVREDGTLSDGTDETVEAAKAFLVAHPEATPCFRETSLGPQNDDARRLQDVMNDVVGGGGHSGSSASVCMNRLERKLHTIGRSSSINEGFLIILPAVR